jgi:prepilin-type N-terminal cleavage/methylation domain-containing protein
MHRPLNGFSLIELVVALAILAAATTIALRATNHLQDQARYTNTISTLNNLQAAIVGPTNERSSDGTALVSGFVADTGRLPEFEAGDPLTELISNPNGITNYQFYTSNIDNSVRIQVGWQGPYLHLGAGATSVLDGWGNRFHGYDSAGVLITSANTPVAQLASWGADNQEDAAHGVPAGSVAIANNYNDDVSIPNPTITGTTTGFTAAAIINGQVTMNIGTDSVIIPPSTQPIVTTSGTAPNPTLSGSPVSIWVDYVGPDLTQTPYPVADDPVLVAVGGTSPIWQNYYPGSAPTSGNNYSGQFQISMNDSPSYTNVTVGPRVIKVYVLPASVTSVSGFRSAVSGGTYTSNPSTTLNVTLTPGAQTINLVLPHYSP